MQLCLGVIYSWSVFRGPLSIAYGWSKTQTIMPYRYSLLAFTFGMIAAGLWQDRKGPRLVASVGGILLGLGCLLAGFNSSNLNGLIFSYGIVAGAGVGFAYVTPIATCIKWFPDKRGFIILSAIFFIFVVGAAQFYKVPPAGWRPEGWNPQSNPASLSAREFKPTEMLATWQFYVLWLTYFLGTSVGLTAIGESTPIIQEMAKTVDVMSAGMALGVMSLCNGAGRLIWGSISDRIGRNRTVLGMCACSIIACVFLLRNAQNFWQLLAGLSLAGFAYGGYLALMPSFTADFYGSKSVGANYGILFSAWGLCGFVVPGYFAGIIDAAKKSGNVAAGYDQVYLGLAGLASLGAVMALMVRKPHANS